MTTRTCKFGCPILLGEWNENARKYHEAATGELHTRERCEAAKAQARVTQGVRNNHGNEDYGEVKDLKVIKDIEQKRAEYVDHTQGQKEKLKLKIFTDPTPEGLALLYNNFGDSHNIRFSQYHPVNALYTIAVFFEEISLKQ